MKGIFIILLFSPFLAIAQHYNDVIELPGTTSDQLYQTAVLFPHSFSTANHVIQLENPAEKKITENGITQIECLISNTPLTINIYFTVDAQFKDNRCIYDIKSSEIRATGGENYSYDLLKEMATKEGLKAFYKSRRIPLWVVGKKKFMQNIQVNQELTAKIENQLHGIVDELELSLKKEIVANN